MLKTVVTKCKMKTNVAIILAGGNGSRFGKNIPKQFTKVAGKEIIEYSTTTFLDIPEISKVVIVCHTNWIEHTKLLFQTKYPDKNIEIIEGGKTRFISSKNALEHLEIGNVGNVLIHDAARPMISKEIIKECLKELQKHKAVTVAVPVKDTIIQVNGDIISSIPNRNNMLLNQTPQCFDFHTIYPIYQQINIIPEDSQLFLSDDCSVVLNHMDIKVVNGSNGNIKITHKNDTVEMKNILENCTKYSKIL
ncbi:MAG: 2-C-methyl-D-erythritol 4-phosphate cytidylyltransferase [Candidatus Deianiraeaceae bacterium]|jgi:2-C-methyl-D-erythritol 4-phosphate cytidylyltransferase